MTRERPDLKAPQPSTRVNFAVPAGACDCHTHIYGDPARFPLSPKRAYTAPLALPEEMAALHRALHIQRVVIVTPSVYGTDNSATLYGMRVRGADARGIAVIDETTPEKDLDRMGQAGVCGIRLNFATLGADASLGRRLFQAAVERVRGRNWHVQILTTPTIITALKGLVVASPVPVVFDHFGGAEGGSLSQRGFSDLHELVQSGLAYVKISGAYRSSALAPDYGDMAPMACALIAANPDRILWGTDWPHPNSTPVPGRRATDIAPPLQIDDGRLMNQLLAWAPNPAVRQKILVDNPARLYRF